MATITFNAAVDNLWGEAGNWDLGIPIGSDDAIIAANVLLGSFNAPTNASTAVVSSLLVQSALDIFDGQLGVALDVGNSGTIRVGTQGTVGTSSQLSVDGTFTNSGGTLEIGATGYVEIDWFDNANGVIRIGDGGEMFVTGDSDLTGGFSYGTIAGTVALANGASLMFGGFGPIVALADGARLEMTGNAQISSNGGSGVGLDLQTLGANAAFSLDDGAAASSTGDLSLASFSSLSLDASTGGSSRLDVAGELAVHAAFVQIGGSGASAGVTTLTVGSIWNDGGDIRVTGSAGPSGHQARIEVAGTADFDGSSAIGVPGTLTGFVSLAGNAVIAFADGVIGSIGSATNAGQLVIDGPDAFITSGAATASNSGLDISHIDGNGILQVRNGAAISSSADLTIAGFAGVSAFEGDAEIDVGGLLEVGGMLFLDADGYQARVHAASLTMGDFGTLRLEGPASGPGKSLVEIDGVAALGANPGEITGTVMLTGNAEIAFGSGTIDHIRAGAALYLAGSGAVISSGGVPGSSGLDIEQIDGGAILSLRGATAASSGNLVVGDGNIVGAVAQLEVIEDATYSVGGALSVLANNNVTVGSVDDVTGTTLGATGIINSGTMTLHGEPDYEIGPTRVTTGAGGFENRGVVDIRVNGMVDTLVYGPTIGGFYRQTASGVTYVDGGTLAGNLDIAGSLFIGQSTHAGLVEGAGSIHASTLVNDAAIQSLWGTLSISSDVTGDGGLYIAQDTTLELTGTVAGSHRIYFLTGAANETLRIDDAALTIGGDVGDVAATILNFAVGDFIELPDLVFTTGLTLAIDSANPNQWEVRDGATVLAAFNFFDPSIPLAIYADAVAGTEIVVLGTYPVTVAQFLAHQGFLDTIPGGFSVTDTAANIAANIGMLSADAHIQSITATGSGEVTMTTAQALALAAAGIDITAPGGVFVSGTEADVGGLTVQQYADLAAIGVTKALVVPPRLGTRSVMTWNSDGTLHDIDYSGITGAPYTHHQVLYGPNGKATEATWWTGTGAVYQVQTNNSDGTTATLHRYGLTGLPYNEFEIVYTANKPSFQTWWTGSHVLYQTQSFYPTGVGEHLTRYAADGVTPTYEAFWWSNGKYQKQIYENVTGQSYTRLEYSYDNSGALLFTDQTNTNGSHTQIGRRNGVTLTSTLGAADTLNGNGSAQVFAFLGSFGHDTVLDLATHLTGTPGTVADTLRFERAGFTDLLTANPLFSAADLLLSSHASQTAQGWAMISDSFGNDVTLKGVSLATLRANTEDVQLV